MRLFLGVLVLLALVACDGNTTFTFPALEGQPDDTADVPPDSADPIVAPSPVVPPDPAEPNIVPSPVVPSATPRPPSNPSGLPTPAPTAGSSLPPSPELQTTLPGLLEFIQLPPAGENWGLVYLNDYERMREAHGILAPEMDAARADVDAYLARVFEETGATGPWLSGYDPRTGRAPEEGYLRFDIGSVDYSIWAEDRIWGGDPAQTHEAMTGRFDPEAIDRLLAACAGCPEPEILEHGGIEFYSWGDDFEWDFQMVLRPPAFDYQGRGGRIAVRDSLVLRTVETEGMQHLIDAHVGNRDSLADNPDMALAAETLDGLGVYSALLVGDVEPFDEVLEIRRACNVVSYCAGEEDVDRMRSLLGMAPESRALDKYILLGTGVGHDEDGLYTLLVFVYENEDVAERNATVFKENLAELHSIHAGGPWTEVFPKSEVWNDGRALIAHLRSESPRIHLSMVVNGESLLIWEQ